MLPGKSLVDDKKALRGSCLVHLAPVPVCDRSVCESGPSSPNYTLTHEAIALVWTSLAEVQLLLSLSLHSVRTWRLHARGPGDA
jgi:hypothetical protein